MNISKLIIKYMVIAGILVTGSFSFANTLSSVQVLSSLSGGEIVLNTSHKTKIKRTNISDNEVKLVINNIYVSDKMTSYFSDLDETDKLNIVNDGNSAVITISEKNIADFKIINSPDNFAVNANSDKNMSIIVFGLFFILSFVLMSRKKTDKSKNIIQNKTSKVMLENKSDVEKSLLQDLQTLRTRSRASNHSAIHGNPVLRFAANSSNANMSIPEGLKSTVPFGRERVSKFKTAVNL